MTPPRKRQRLSLDGGTAQAPSDMLPTTTKGEDQDVEMKEEKTDGKTQTTNGSKEDKTKKEGEDATSQRRSLFVRALPSSTTTESLTEMFSQSYPIKHATAVMDKETSQCKGYGFVTFADAEDCQRAKQEFNGFMVDGRKLRCEVAEPRNREKDAGAVAPPTAGQKFKEEREKQKTEYLPTKLIVRNLPWSIKGPNQLTKLFQSYGKIKHAVVPMKKPGLLSGFGFVTMRGRKNAEKALEGVNGKEVDGRTLAVDWAVDRETWQGKSGEDQPDEPVEEDDEQEEKEEEEDDGANEHLDLDDDDDQSDEDDEDDYDEDMDMDGDENDKPEFDRNDNSSTLFVRNLPFTCSDEDLEDHFTQFGSVRYARVVLDHGTGRPRGNGFVCFYNLEDADNCIREAPRHQPPKPVDGKAKDPAAAHVSKSILQNDESDPSGRYTLDGRVLQVSRAVNKSDAERLTKEGQANRFKRDTDKRRLYLLSEGTIPTNSPLYAELSPSEQTMREASVKQRKTLIESNPSLHLSLTRLSIRNLPRTITSKDLKQLAREAIVGFATDVKKGIRQPLSKEELSRGGEEMQQAERDRRARAKGVVKQAKIVFEGREGGKVEEKSGAGRSRGYGFIEYYTHRSALMGLRWLNGHAIGYQAQEPSAKGKRISKEAIAERKKRLIVEFAIENAQVVQRRKEREVKSHDRREILAKSSSERRGDRGDRKFPADKKRKRGSAQDEDDKSSSAAATADMPADEREKLANRQRIIQKKRMARRARNGGK
ncbi:hypothetical protein AAFC00_005400 [Neodothiora populina]|uniref:RRM domain-containing protein n=1 Tax=Neodothiora populina TaxID=2781224 RepID=A0ABR3PKR9_9PEZI